MEAIIAGGILLLIQVLMGAVLMNSRDNVRDLKQDLARLAEELINVKINYVHKQEIRDLKEEISEKFTDLKMWIKEELKDK